MAARREIRCQTARRPGGQDRYRVGDRHSISPVYHVARPLNHDSSDEAFVFMVTTLKPVDQIDRMTWSQLYSRASPPCLRI